ncbi:uncharacterized protein [Polyergus mexicanus]|uniref:uncharacterized protein n=1 Tax=Polyergus mexicanus TaxID=615972 RepID=UPI0038B5F074
MPNEGETTPVRPEPTPDHTEPTLPDSTASLDRIRKWGLCFEGKDPFAFLERIVELRRSYRYADELFLLGLPEMLRGNPLLWYRNNYEDWTTWDAFCTVFRLKYLPPDYQDQLQQDAQARRQRPGESFDQYVTDLLTMMRRAGGYTPQEKARLVYNNLHSSYQLYIRPAEAASVAELSARAAKHEKVLRRQKKEQPPTLSMPSSPVIGKCIECKCDFIGQIVNEPQKNDDVKMECTIHDYNSSVKHNKKRQLKILIVNKLLKN